MTQKYRKQFENLAKLMDIPIKFGMIKAIANKLGLTRDDINNWMRKGIPSYRVDFFRSVGYPLEIWWVEQKIPEFKITAQKCVFYKEFYLNNEDCLDAAKQALEEIYNHADEFMIAVLECHLSFCLRHIRTITKENMGEGQ